MKSWIKRFGMLAVLGSLACGVLVAGCAGAPEEEAAPVDNAAETAPAPDAAPAGDGS